MTDDEIARLENQVNEATRQGISRVAQNSRLTFRGDCSNCGKQVYANVEIRNVTSSTCPECAGLIVYTAEKLPSSFVTVCAYCEQQKQMHPDTDFICAVNGKPIYGICRQCLESDELPLGKLLLFATECGCKLGVSKVGASLGRKLEDAQQTNVALHEDKDAAIDRERKVRRACALQRRFNYVLAGLCSILLVMVLW